MSKVLVVGGTGTLGSHLVPYLLDDKLVERVRILSRDEHKQQEMARAFPDRCDWFIGDVRDRDRVVEAMRGVDVVFNLAAMKTVDGCEYQPMESVNTNVIGADNVVYAAKANKVQRAIFLSSDKAVSSLNCYGASKALAEKLFIQGNVGSLVKFAACRYGNVLGSQGSVLEKWIRSAKETGTISVTNSGMTRFWWTPQDAALFVGQCMDRILGAEVFIPKMKSCSMGRLGWAFQEIAMEKLGIMVEIKDMPERPGEKIHELLYNAHEAPLVRDCGDYFIRYPSSEFYPVRMKGKAVWSQEYSSATSMRLSDDDLCEMVSSQWPENRLLKRAISQINTMFGG